MRHRYLIPLIGMALAVQGCGPKVREARFRAYPPRPASHEITVYQTTRPECPFEEIGTVTVQKRNAFVSAQDMLDTLRERARGMGGDGLVALSEGSRVSGAVASGAVVGVVNQQTYTATVLRFTDTDCTREVEPTNQD